MIIFLIGVFAGMVIGIGGVVLFLRRMNID